MVGAYSGQPHGEHSGAGLGASFWEVVHNLNGRCVPGGLLLRSLLNPGN